MKNQKLFTIAGTSTSDGKTKFRVATGSLNRRASVLKSVGHTNINLTLLPQPMTRAQAMQYLGVQSNSLTIDSDTQQSEEIVLQLPPESAVETFELFEITAQV